ncbi:hypothetical protein FHW67_002276 [Herbaspirillum sp. Sphag1AN]|nr:hypothetical protein [Herbaspirillum sp. Sphag1AN]MBB3246185.1 hypothetical protein [Herbaspirillum sp. Sphag64]
MTFPIEVLTAVMTELAITIAVIEVLSFDRFECLGFYNRARSRA